MKTIFVVALVAGALSLAVPAVGAPIGPPTDTGGIPWTAQCANADHPVQLDGSCGWIAAPRRFAFCHDYPGGTQVQLTCYSPVSGWVVNISVDDPPGKQPSAWRDASVVHRTTWATVLHAGNTWYDDRPISANVMCQAAKKFFRCTVNLCHVAKISGDCLIERDYGVWFKPNGTFLLYRIAVDQRTLSPTGRLAVIYGSR
jgi:hypothetical protein